MKNLFGGDSSSFDAILSAENKERRVHIKKSIKDDILRNQKGKCAICNLIFLQTGIFPPDYHHKDGNHSNSKPENIEAICPNCHRKETYKQWVDKAKSPKKKKDKTFFGIEIKSSKSPKGFDWARY